MGLYREKNIEQTGCRRAAPRPCSLHCLVEQMPSGGCLASPLELRRGITSQELARLSGDKGCNSGPPSIHRSSKDWSFEPSVAFPLERPRMCHQGELVLLRRSKKDFVGAPWKHIRRQDWSLEALLIPVCFVAYCTAGAETHIFYDRRRKFACGSYAQNVR